MLIAVVMLSAMIPTSFIPVRAAETITSRTPHKLTEETAEMFSFPYDDSWYPYRDYYAIRDVEELYGFAELVNNGEVYANAVLLQNITVNDTVSASGAAYSWTPIGKDAEHAYRGTFLGGGHTISGLYCNMPNATGVGFFGYIGVSFGYNGTVIKDVILLNSYFKGNSHVGGIVGMIHGYGNRIEKCMVSTDVTVTATRSYRNGNPESFYIGGIAGGFDAAVIKQTNYIDKCVSFAAVEGIITESPDMSDLDALNKIEMREMMASTNIGAISGTWQSGSDAGKRITLVDCYYLRNSARVYDPENDSWLAYANYSSGGKYLNVNGVWSPWGSNTGSTTMQTVSDSHTCIEVSSIALVQNCTYEGQGNYKFCIICGDYYLGVVPAWDILHKYRGANCTDNGVCVICGDANGDKDPGFHKSWAEATCMTVKTCTSCGATEGEKNPSNHVSGEGYTYSVNAGDQLKHDARYAQCGAFVKTEAHTYNKNGKCTKCSYQCKHDSYTGGVCTTCGYKCTHSKVSDGKCTACGVEGSYMYIDRAWNSTTKQVDETAKLATPAIKKVTASTTTMKTGWYIVEGEVYIKNEITVTGTVHLILADNANLTGGTYGRIVVSEGNTLYIYAQSDSENMGAISLNTPWGAITGNEKENAGTIIINGGNITANANSNQGAAAIGGYRGDGGNITINGGVITATHTGEGCAAIGGGNYGAGGNITINGGTVTATGSEYGAGIGGGNRADGGNITINGGIVTATGGYKGAGIGGGLYYSGGNITITGGTIIANGTTNAADIGGGYEGDGGTIVITGGNIKADTVGKGLYGADGTLKDGSGNDVSLHTLTLSGATDGTPVTNISGYDYGYTDVKTLDTDKLYFWLADADVPASITAGGIDYLCNNELTFTTDHDWSQNNGVCVNCGLCKHETYNENGFCANCDVTQPAELVDGYYQIANAGNLFWFANHINTVDKTANARLTADIDLENRPWTPIGVEGGVNAQSYRGVFDGNGKTIRGLYVDAQRNALGFFGEVRDGTVKNFTIYGEVKLIGKHDYVGGVIGSACGTGNDVGATISNITSYVNVTLGEGSHGSNRVAGFVGYVNHNTNIENCIWYGTLDLDIYRAQDGVGGLVGKAHSSFVGAIRNCAAYGTIRTAYQNGSYVNPSNNTPFDTIYIGGIVSNSVANAKTVIENTIWAGQIIDETDLGEKAHISAFGTLSGIASVTNCYWWEGTVPYITTNNNNSGNITAVSYGQLISGEIAYKLGAAWGQMVGTENLPVVGGKKVYYGYTDCEATEKIYSNSLLIENAGHAYGEDHICVNCGERDPEAVMLGDVDGNGAVTNADVLMIFRYIYNADLYPLDTAVGDVDGNGTVTNSDVLAIFRYIYNPALYPLG